MTHALLTFTARSCLISRSVNVQQWKFLGLTWAKYQFTMCLLPFGQTYIILQGEQCRSRPGTVIASRRYGRDKLVSKPQLLLHHLHNVVCWGHFMLRGRPVLFLPHVERVSVSSKSTIAVIYNHVTNFSSQQAQWTTWGTEYSRKTSEFTSTYAADTS